MEAETDRGARDWFRLMIDMGLAPGLRAMGFVGTGRRFRRQVDRHWAEISVTESPSLVEGRIRFTLHLRVLCRDEWAEQLRVRPYTPGAAGQPNAGWESAIGGLVTVGGYPIDDLWWELEVGRPFESLSREVLNAVRTFGIPAITHQIRLAG